MVNSPSFHGIFWQRSVVLVCDRCLEKIPWEGELLTHQTLVHHYLRDVIESLTVLNDETFVSDSMTSLKDESVVTN